MFRETCSCSRLQTAARHRLHFRKQESHCTIQMCGSWSRLTHRVYLNSRTARDKSIVINSFLVFFVFLLGVTFALRELSKRRYDFISVMQVLTVDYFFPPADQSEQEQGGASPASDRNTKNSRSQRGRYIKAHQLKLVLPLRAFSSNSNVAIVTALI